MEETSGTAPPVIGVEEFQWMRQSRAPVACQQCRIQRTRCDVVLKKGSCTNCAFYEIECQVVTGKRKARALGHLVTIPAGQVYMRPPECAADRSSGGADMPQPTLPLTEKPANISDEEFVLLRNKGLFEMPGTELRHRMVEAYLRHAYGNLPVISFQDLVFMADPGRRYSNWFVFMAVCAISVNLVDKVHLEELGVRSAKEASQMFFAKAEALYRFQWQGHQKYTTLQGLLVLAFCEKEVYMKDGWSWTWAAYTTAVQLGLDQKSTKMSVREGGLRRRLWWTCYTQSCLINLHSTGPPRIRIPETDVPPLTEKDFEPQKPIFCLDLIPSLTMAQESCSAFIQKVQLLRMYNECTLREQMARGTGQVATDVLLDLKQIFRSATKTDFKPLLGEKDTSRDNSICSIPSSPLDTGPACEPQEEPHLSTSTICMFLDMERILYNCASESEAGTENNELDVFPY
ncbi:hypothetical protein ASPCAL12319 [Aspergillus calidoustus]|uniref:Zn(2)-C6 fungal-type domain-containing protein n=1 Tax=Aspergillus calidoustus TaxID=454130 RepID=A0A0U5GBV2_ASPCI|nr:hypothetical protein ASPCAL12319 [Aspergillus calidoustus]